MKCKILFSGEKKEKCSKRSSFELFYPACNALQENKISLAGYLMDKHTYKKKVLVQFYFPLFTYFTLHVCYLFVFV